MLDLRAIRVSGFRDEKVAWRRVREGYGAGYGGPLPVLAGRSRCGAGPPWPWREQHGVAWLPLPGTAWCLGLARALQAAAAGPVQSAATATIHTDAAAEEKPADRRGLLAGKYSRQCNAMQACCETGCQIVNQSLFKKKKS